MSRNFRFRFTSLFFLNVSRPICKRICRNHSALVQIAPSTSVLLNRNLHFSAIRNETSPNLDSKLPVSQSTARVGKELPPLDDDGLGTFDNLLLCVGKGTEFKNVKFLIRAPYFARRVDDFRRSEFLSIIDKWWLQVEKHIRTEQFDITHFLYQLGSWNAEACGQVLRNLGGEKMLDFLIGLWLETGLEQLPFEDVMRGLAGLRGFYRVGLGGSVLIDKKKLTNWKAFLLALDRYCATKTEVEAAGVEIDEMGLEHRRVRKMDSGREVDEMGSFGLGFLGLLRSLEEVLPDEALQKLNKLAVMAFTDYIARGGESTTCTKDMFEQKFETFAEFWLWYRRRNPNYFGKQPVPIWFDAFAVHLATCPAGSVGLRTLNFAPSLAHRLDSVGNFLKIYDPWHNAVLNHLHGMQGIDRDAEANHVSKMIFYIGKLATCGRFPLDMVTKLDILVDELMDAFCSINPRCVSNRFLQTAFTGYRDVKRTVRPDGSLPESVATFLRQWCNIFSETLEHRKVAAVTASMVLLLLSQVRLRTTEGTLNDLSKLYFWSLASTPSQDMPLVLWTYAAACHTFRHDPCDSVADGGAPWATWFHFARQCLKNHRRSKLEGRFHKLLLLMCEVALTFQRVGEFQHSQNAWEDAVTESLAAMNRSDQISICNRVKRMQQQHSIVFRSEFLGVLLKRS